MKPKDLEKKLKITSNDELQKIRENFKGEIVELPNFDSGKPFVAKLKRVALLDLVCNEILPNALLGAVQEIYEGKQKTDIKKYSETLNIIARLSLIEPNYENIKDILTDAQKVAILAYATNGVSGLLPFRAFFEK
jgi:superfamily I DNA/RNA helicase